MFDGAGNNMFAAALIGVCGAFDRKVCRFGTAGREDDVFQRLGVDQRGDPFACALERVAGQHPMMMQGGCAAKNFRGPCMHRVEDLGQNRRGSLMVEVDLAHT